MVVATWQLTKLGAVHKLGNVSSLDVGEALNGEWAEPRNDVAKKGVVSSVSLLSDGVKSP